MRYITPLGKFKTLTEAGKASNISHWGAKNRFMSSNFPDWIDTKREKIKKKSIGCQPGSTRTITDTKNYGLHIKKAIQTPMGRFDSLTEAAKFYKVSQPTMKNWCGNTHLKKQGFYLIEKDASE